MTDAGDTVQVDLLSTTDTSRGHEWPTRPDGSLSETIDDAEALLVANDALVDELAGELGSWRSHEETEEAEWPSSGDRLAARVQLVDDVELAIRLRRGGDEGWFYTVSLFRPVETWPVSG